MNRIGARGLIGVCECIDELKHSLGIKKDDRTFQSEKLHGARVTLREVFFEDKTVEEQVIFF